jgi:hypothetical protein
MDKVAERIEYDGRVIHDDDGVLIGASPLGVNEHDLVILADENTYGTILQRGSLQTLASSTAGGMFNVLDAMGAYEISEAMRIRNMKPRDLAQKCTLALEDEERHCQEFIKSQRNNP